MGTLGAIWVGCEGPIGPHSATLQLEMHFFSACVAPSIFGNKAAKFGNGHGGCKVWGPGHLGGHGHTWGHLGGGHKMPIGRQSVALQLNLHFKSAFPYMETGGCTFGLRFVSDLNGQDESSFIDLSHDMQGSHGGFKK